MYIYELQPNEKQKSFYGKATVVVGDDGTRTLYSYGTAIIKQTADGELVRLWDDWSATTGKHIKAFCGINKAEYDRL